MVRSIFHTGFVLPSTFHIAVVTVLVCMYGVSDIVSAADAPGKPTTTPYTVTSPVGYTRVTGGGHTAICATADESWVAPLLASIQPAEKPTTSPADLLTRLKDGRQALIDQLTSQAALPDQTAATELVDNRLVSIIDRAVRTRIPLVYLIITRDELKKAVRAGWSPELFNYDKNADSVSFIGSISASVDGSGGESLITLLYSHDDNADARNQEMTRIIQGTDANSADLISKQCQAAIEAVFADFVDQKAIKPMAMPLDQQWFASGVVGYFSAVDVAAINGSKPQDSAESLSHPVKGNPIDGNTIDLLHPVPPELLRVDLVIPYGDALRRRSIGIVNNWVKRAGPDAAVKTLAAYRANKPKDAKALLELIQKTTGVDLSGELAASK